MGVMPEPPAMRPTFLAGSLLLRQDAVELPSHWNVPRGPLNSIVSPHSSSSKPSVILPPSGKSAVRW